MSNPSRESSDLAIVCDLMREAVTVMDEFPMDSVPPDMAMPERESSGSDQWSRAPSIEGILSDPQVQAWLQEIIDSWPKNLMPVFLQASGILGQVLEMFGARGDGGMTDILAAGMTDPETIQMMSALAQIDREMTEHEKDKDDEQKFDPMGMQEALLTELRRRGTAHRSPVRANGDHASGPGRAALANGRQPGRTRQDPTARIHAHRLAPYMVDR